MKKVLFHERVFSIGGTTKALLDYAKYNELILGNKTFLAFESIEKSLNTDYLQNKLDFLKQKYEILMYSSYRELENYIEENRIQYHYNIKSGEIDQYLFLSNIAKNCIHAVFPQNQNQLHGDVYAFVSKWLSDSCGVNIPYVPHIVDLHLNVTEINKNFRKKHNIPDAAKVFGRIGSYNSFNIKFVYDVIKTALFFDSNIWFVFVNTEKFIEHERVLFLPAILEDILISEFIDGCDAMIHARDRGETFGLSVAEFSVKNKPVLTYANSSEKAHLDILKEQALIYKNENELLKLFLEFDTIKYKNNSYNAYSQFSPNTVMRIFDSVFLQNEK